MDLRRESMVLGWTPGKKTFATMYMDLHQENMVFGLIKLKDYTIVICHIHVHGKTRTKFVTSSCLLQCHPY